MLVKELLKQIADAVVRDPEVMNATIIQQSCMDSPAAYETLRLYIGDEYFVVGDYDVFLENDEAEYRAEEDAETLKHVKGPILVLEAI